METAELLVIAAAAIGIAWVNAYFFGAGRQRVAATSPAAGGAQEVTVRVEGGYLPSTIRARRGVPLRLVFDRRESGSCSEEVVLPDFGVRRFLPAFERTPVEVTPAREGTYEFTCGMGMLRGRIVVEDGEG